MKTVLHTTAARVVQRLKLELLNLSLSLISVIFSRILLVFLLELRGSFTFESFETITADSEMSLTFRKLKGAS
jgi:hypothetical protein